MIDAFYAHSLEVKPVIRSDTRHFSLPCRIELFNACDAVVWRSLSGNQALPRGNSILIYQDAAILPPLQDHLGMFGLLSTLWARLSQANIDHHLRECDPQGRNPEGQTRTLLGQNPQAQRVSSLLVEVYRVYAEFFEETNLNCLVSWNITCLYICSDHSLFENAAGRRGPGKAREAIDKIKLWALTPPARRACLHAAQTYFVMRHRRTVDMTFFHTETALFSAALVLGLYLFALGDNQDEGDIGKIFEIVGPIDWTKVGLAGLVDNDTNFSGDGEDSCAARDFIVNGGFIAFSGILHRGGFQSARLIFLDYLALLQEVGRWKAREFCHILRVMSDMTEKA